jgi:hypothetical protein
MIRGSFSLTLIVCVAFSRASFGCSFVLFLQVVNVVIHLSHCWFYYWFVMLLVLFMVCHVIGVVDSSCC